MFTIKTHQSAAQWQASQWIGYPVCIVLKDGSYYVGTITGVDSRNLTMTGMKGQGTIKSLQSRSGRHEAQAQISGLLGSLFGLGGGGGGAANPLGNGFGGLGGFGNQGAQNGNNQGFFGKIWPGIRLGFGVLQTILPLMGMFKL